ncbi:unnamed protein product [Cylicostephanus goldi]|uniref:Mediator of RNA polymerase II transcription subunit 20 n=1 Tax=Cylicostephanus goldi TaxID=71465 RepID=A0A3P7N4R0_CYLGO|nr:unnamed protein product [Cylicostephanus goldi]
MNSSLPNYVIFLLSSALAKGLVCHDTLTGVEYRLRDFVVRVGTASQVTTTKGVIVEVEYEPSQVAVQSAHMMTEMMQMFFPQYVGDSRMQSSTSHPMWRVVFEHVDEARAMVNRQCSHLESWQIISYTISMCFLIVWFRRMNRSDKPFIQRFRYVMR